MILPAVFGLYTLSLRGLDESHNMAKLRLHIDEFDEIDYELIAIHTVLEDYRLAFLLNRKLHIRLARTPDDFEIESPNGTALLSRFVFEDLQTGSFWSLLQNRGDIHTAVKAASDLFGQSDATFGAQNFLLPELKNVNFLLQLQNGVKAAHEIAAALQQIELISTAYSVDISQIKSRNNLIF